MKQSSSVVSKEVIMDKTYKNMLARNRIGSYLQLKRVV